MPHAQDAPGASPPVPSPPVHASVAAAAAAPPAAPPPLVADADDEPGLFAIIDETGEGWGFELTPSTVAKPLAILGGVLFAVGAMAGVPAGLALGRSAAAADDAAAPAPPAATAAGRPADPPVAAATTPAAAASAAAPSRGAAPRPAAARAELSGVLFATKAFGLGTLLCAAGGAAAVVVTRWSLGD